MHAKRKPAHTDWMKHRVDIAYSHRMGVVYFTGYPDFGLPQNLEAIEEAKKFLLPSLADGRLKPKISDVFKLEDVSEAHRSLESNKQVGKIILAVGQPE